MLITDSAVPLTKIHNDYSDSPRKEDREMRPIYNPHRSHNNDYRNHDNDYQNHNNDYRSHHNQPRSHHTEYASHPSDHHNYENEPRDFPDKSHGHSGGKLPVFVFSSPELKAQGELIVYQSSRRLFVWLCVWLCVCV